MARVKNLLMLLKRIFKSMPLIVLFSLMTPFISGAITVYIYSAQVDLINIMVNSLGTSSYKDIIGVALIPMAIYLSISILQLFLEFIQKINMTKLNASSTNLLQTDIVNLCNKIDYEEFSSDVFGNRLQRANAVLGEDLVVILNSLTQSITIFSSIISLVLLALKTKYNIVALVISIMILINLAIKFYTEVRVVRLGRAITLDGRVGDYMAKTLYTSHMIREARIYNCISYFKDIWAKKNQLQNNVRYKARRTEIKTGILVTIVQTTAILFILLYLINAMKNHQENASIGVMSVLVLGVLQSSYKILTLSWPLGQLYIKSAKLYELNELLTYNNEHMKKNKPICTGQIVPIQVKNVTFMYPNTQKEILKNIFININRGEKVAIVGENGAGKSTLIKLIVGLYSPHKGKISWGDNEVAPENIAIVYQNYIKYELTLRENIGFGNMSKLNDDKAILEVINSCGLSDLYHELGGLDVKLGRLYEGGRELSGGQWQRIAIARALISDSELIIFDEPTAAIDPNSELEIYNMLMELCKEKTAIFISHRLGWAKNADKIMVINKGKIVEVGNHVELLKKEGQYAEMYNMQASWYTKDEQIDLISKGVVSE